VAGNIREAITPLSLNGGPPGFIAATAIHSGAVTFDAPGIWLDALGVAHLVGAIMGSATGSGPATILSTPFPARFRPANYQFFDMPNDTLSPDIWTSNSAF